MLNYTQVKVGLALIGLILFGVGARFDNPTVRWVAIGVMAAAFLLRFSRRPKS
jgi:hypothetical protein